MTNAQNIFIRTATERDAPIIADISRETFYETFASYNTKENMDKFMDTQFTRQALIDEVGAPGNDFLMAYNGDELLGYARLRSSYNPAVLGEVDSIEIVRIYALQKAIGRGVGKALMQACIDLAIKQNKELIWLGVWEHNARAIAFYTKWGFEKFEEHVFLLGDDNQTDWLMKKNLII